MIIDFLGSESIPYIELAIPLAGSIALALLGLATLAFLVRVRHDFRRLATARRATLFGLALVAALILAQVLVVRPPAPTPPMAPGQPHPPAGPGLALLGALPVLAAALWLGPGPAVLVGLASGLAHAGWDTFRVTQPLELALWAGLLSAALRQNYRGLVGNVLRQPLLAAPLASLLVAWPLALLSIASLVPVGSLASLEMTLALALPTLFGLAGEALLAGGVAQLLLVAAPHLRPVRRETLVSPPWTRHLNRRIVFALAPIMALAIVILVSAVALAAYGSATNLVIDQMARDAATVSEGLPLFVEVGRNLLDDLAQDERLLSEDSDARQARLDEGLRSVTFFQQLIYFDGDGQPSTAYPETDSLQALVTDDEQTLVNLALESASPGETSTRTQDDASSIAMSFVAPVFDADSGDVSGVLLGRTALATNPLVQPVVDVLSRSLVDGGQGFIIDEANNVLLNPSQPALEGATFELSAASEIRSGTQEGIIYRETRSDGTQQLVYLLPVVAQPDWSVVVTVPNQVVLGRATTTALPVLAILLVMAALGLPIVATVSRRLTEPTEALAKAADRIATGQLDAPVLVAGEDEVGRLGLAFEDMRRGLKARLDEQERLLSIGYAVSASLELERAMPPILDAALDATDALGVRIVLPGADGDPQTYTAGDGARDMAPMDDELAEQADSQGTLVVSRMERARDTLASSAQVPDIEALVALPLRSETVYLGLLWLAYDEEHAFEQSELTFLSSLASQASFAVANARLFEAAEGGRRQLAAILASTTDAVLVVDDQRRLQLINPAAERALNITASRARGQDFEAAITHDELVKLLGTDEAGTASVELAMADGRTLLASASPIIGADKTTLGRVVVLSDISYLKELDDMKNAFVRAVSHDLRAPLTYMSGYTTMLPMVGDLNQKQQDFVGRLQSGIAEMTDLIEKLLNLGRIEAGAPLDLEACDVRDLLTSCYTTLIDQAGAKDLDFTLDLPEHLPHMAADTTLLRQAILNLLENAIKYAPEGESVTLGATARDDTITFSVEDTGYGIKPEHQEKLFQPFFRAKDRNTATVKGSGLGLAIVKGTAERHGGRVYAESEPGKGSTFYIEMPIRQPIAEPEPEQAT